MLSDMKISEIHIYQAQAAFFQEHEAAKAAASRRSRQHFYNGGYVPDRPA
jgi:hypothetical protein